MRQEIAVQFRLRQERNAGIVRKHAVAAHRAALVPPQEGQRLHREQVRADDRIIAAVQNELPQLPRMPGVRQIDRRGHARRAVHLPGMIHHAEHLRGLGGNAVEHLVEAQRPLFAEGLEHVQKLGLVSARQQRLPDGHGAVVVSLARTTAQKQDLHAASSHHNLLSLYRTAANLSSKRDFFRKINQYMRPAHGNTSPEFKIRRSSS